MSRTLALIQTLAFAAFLAIPARANIFQATLMEPNQPTAEISTDELKLILQTGSAVVFDARPYNEFAVSHIPGAVNVAPKPGQPASQYTSDVREIGRLLEDNTSAAIVLYCNGPFCGKSKRLSADLMAAGYKDVRRYQLGMPVWRALGGLSQIELPALKIVLHRDGTAVFVDARPADVFQAGSLRRATNIPLAGVTKAKDDGRLPMEDHNTRIVVFGETADQAKAVAAELGKNAFDNVTYFNGTWQELSEHLSRDDDGRDVRAREP